MKLFVVIMLSLFFIKDCQAQSQLPAEMPEKIAVYLNESGAMRRSFKKVMIDDGVLEYEMSNGNGQNSLKWSAQIYRKDLTKLYQTFVENKFDAIKNDKRQGTVYDAGSESIAISINETKSFNVTYGKNSPLSGKNLEHYQAVRTAIYDLIANHQNGIQTGRENEKYIQGTWRAGGDNAGHAWFLEWTFENGNFKQIGYPPITQEGKYRVVSVADGKITLELYEQKGTFGEEPGELKILIDKEANQLTISGTKGFSPVAPNKNE